MLSRDLENARCGRAAYSCVAGDAMFTDWHAGMDRLIEGPRQGRQSCQDVIACSLALLDEVFQIAHLARSHIIAQGVAQDEDHFGHASLYSIANYCLHWRIG